MLADAPRVRGWRPAPAWARPNRFWLVWPAATGDRDRDEAAREDCLGLAEFLSDHAPVTVVCPSGTVAECALRTPPGVAALAAEHDGSALGSHAPLWLTDADGRLAAAVVHSPLSRQMAELAGLPVLERPPGLPAALESDGEGTVLAPACPPEQVGEVEAVLRDWLGAENVIWLNPLQPGGPSVGARFLAPGVVGVSIERDPRHPGFAACAANRDTLALATDAAGRRLVLVELPAAKRRNGCYADCLVAGNQVVVPEFEDGRGTEAFAQVAAALPGRHVAAFPATWIAPLGAGLGAAVVVEPAGAVAP